MHPGWHWREQTAGSCQPIRRGAVRLSCGSGRCGWLPRSAISTRRSGLRWARLPGWSVSARRNGASGYSKPRSMSANAPVPRRRNRWAEAAEPRKRCIARGRDFGRPRRLSSRPLVLSCATAIAFAPAPHNLALSIMDLAALNHRALQHVINTRRTALDPSIPTSIGRLTSRPRSRRPTSRSVTTVAFSGEPSTSANGCLVPRCRCPRRHSRSRRNAAIDHQRRHIQPRQVFRQQLA
jgi:hypothetical protein